MQCSEIMKLVERKVCTYSWKWVFFFSRLILQTLIVVLIQGVNFGTLKSSKMRGSLDKLAGYKGIQFRCQVKMPSPKTNTSGICMVHTPAFWFFLNVNLQSRITLKYQKTKRGMTGCFCIQPLALVGIYLKVWGRVFSDAPIQGAFLHPKSLDLQCVLGCETHWVSPLWISSQVNEDGCVAPATCGLTNVVP